MAAPSPPFPWRALVAVGFWGASFPAIRVGLEGFHPFGLACARLVLGVGLLGALVARRNGPRWPRRADLGRCVLLGCVLAAHLALQAYGLRYTSAIRTGWFVAFTPIAIAVGARWFLGDTLAGSRWIGVGVASAGVLGVTATRAADFADATRGDALQLVSCFTWTAFTLLAVGPARRNGALVVSVFTLGVATLVLGVAACFTGFLAPRATLGVEVWAAVGFLGIFCSGIGYALWTRSQAESGAQRAATTLYFEPFFTLAAAAVLLGEAISPRELAFGLVVLAGVWLVNRRR